MVSARLECFGGRLDGDHLQVEDVVDAAVEHRDGVYRRLGPKLIAVFVPIGGIDRHMALIGRVRSCPTCGKLVVGGGARVCTPCREVAG